MKRVTSFFGVRFWKLYTIVPLTGLLIMLSCKKETVSIVDTILGDYKCELRTFVFPPSCPNSATLLDVGSSFTIKRSPKNVSDGIEIHFVNSRDSFWYGQVKGDSLKIPKQIVGSTNPNYIPGFNEVDGFALIKGDVLEFTIQETYTTNKYVQVCDFMAKRK